MAYSSPDDLASAVRQQLDVRGIGSLELSDIASVFHVLFGASLHTEEGRPIMAQLVVIDPADPDPHPPERRVPDLWSVVPLAEALPLQVSTLVKVASATDPRTSSLAVYATEAGLRLWGLLDQGNRYFEFLNFDSESGPPAPGDFHGRIEGPGHLTVWARYHKIGELRVNELVELPIDALRAGPVIDALVPGLNAYIEEVQGGIPDDVYEARGHWDGSLVADWTATLSRVLSRARNFRHGGAFLLTPEPDHKFLEIKYGIDYPRLHTGLVARGKARIARTHASDQIFEYLESDADELPMLLHLDSPSSRRNPSISRRRSTARFVSWRY